jgi:ankyrin repeat protein
MHPTHIQRFWTALHCAARYGHTSAAKALLAQLDVNSTDHVKKKKTVFVSFNKFLLHTYVHMILILSYVFDTSLLTCVIISKY